MLPLKYQRNLAFGFAVIAGLSGFAALVCAQEGTSPPPLKVNRLADGVYWVQGGVGSHTGILVGTDGVVLVDPKETPESAKGVLAEVAKLTPKPVTTVIVTHSNADHVRGLPGYPKGTNIIAHANCAKDLDMETHFVEEYPELREHLPTHVVDKSTSLKLHGINIQLLHFAPAHTNGDLIVFLPDHKIAFDGGVIGTNVHLENGGSTEGLIESLKGIVALDFDTIVHGHRGPQTKAEVRKVLADTTAKREKIKQLFAEGKSLDEIEKAVGETVKPRVAVSPLPPLRTFRPFRSMSFTEVVYTELSQQR